MPPEGAGLDTNAPAVAAAPGKVLVVVGIMVAFVLFMLYTIFGGSGESDAPPPSAPRVGQVSTELPDTQIIPDIPDIDQPAPPAPPPLVFPQPTLPAPEPITFDRQFDEQDTEALRREEALKNQRLRSSMLLVDGGGNATPPVQGDGADQPVSNDPNLAFAQRVRRSSTDAEKVYSKHIGDLRRTVAQGRIIPAVLETAINTDLPGSIRAIVSRDVFAEAGRTPVVPYGSRLIGEYNTDVLGGQSRVFAVWTRIIRPDGVDIQLNSPLIDPLGQAGVNGTVDSKFTSIFKRALLTTLINIGVGVATNELIGDDANSTSTTDSEGNVTSSGTVASESISEGLSSFGNIMQQYLLQFIDVAPTILVDQGTKIKIFVNQDLIFPSQNGGVMIP